LHCSKILFMKISNKIMLVTCAQNLRDSRGV
jgi:hypothetical protein